MKNIIALGIIALSLSMNADATTVLQPKEVVELYFQSLRTGDLATLASLLDEHVVWHQPGQSVLSGTYNGKEAVLQLFSRFTDISKGSFKIDEVTSVTVQGSLVVATLSFSAHRCQYMDLSMQMGGVDVMRVQDGVIKEVVLISENQPEEDNFWGLR